MSAMALSLTGVARRLAKSLPRTRVIKQSLHTTSAGQHIVRSSAPELDLPSGNVVPLVLERAAEWGHHIASECSVTGRGYTYSQVVDSSARLAGMLAKMGIGKGDIVAAVMPNCPEYPIVLLACLRAGVILTTVNSNYTSEEIYRQLKDSKAKMVVFDPALEATVDASLELLQQPILLAANGPSSRAGTINLRQVFEDSSFPLTDPVELTGTELAIMPYSSGTTGPPKGVAVSHNALSSNIKIFTTPFTFPTPKATASHQESFMCLLPFYHIYGILPITLVGMTAGVKLVSVPNFDPNTFVDILTKHKMSTLHLVPPLMNFLIQSPKVTPENMAHVKHTLIGAAPVSSAAAQSFKDKLKKDIFVQEGYGMTEVLITHATHVGHNTVGSCGQPLPNVQVKVIDTEGKELKAHEDGELLIKTPSMMTGYFNNEAATEETIDADGWLHTGDVGHYDDEGFFKIVDRTKELIKVKGLQVAPSELEDLIGQYPGVVEVGVVGVPDERMGEAPRAYVVASKNIAEADIQKFLEPRVAPHKKLVGGVVFVDALPKSPIGKLLRRELRRMAEESS